MIKFVIKNEKILEFVVKSKILKHLFIYRIDYLDKIRSNDLYNFAQSLFILNNYSKKTTWCGRFKEIDAISVGLMTANERNIIHDIAVSSGITSLDLYNEINKKQLENTFFISDKYSTFFIQKKKIITKVFDADYNLLHYYFLIFLADKKLNKTGFFSIILFHLIQKFDFSCDNKAKMKRIVLYDKRVMKLIEENKIMHIDYDILKNTIKDHFTFVRAMNIVNKNFFSDLEIKNIIENIKKSLKENGIFQIGITEGEINRISFFRLYNNEFIRIRDINNGYPDKCNSFV